MRADRASQRDAVEYRIEVHDDPERLDAAAWDALVEAQPSATPFMRHAYLAALHASASAVPDTGWAPQFLCLLQGDSLVAACPLYLKFHSYGEYVLLCRMSRDVQVASGLWCWEVETWERSEVC